jgi:hypothetical protein
MRLAAVAMILFVCAGCRSQASLPLDFDPQVAFGAIPSPLALAQARPGHAAAAARQASSCAGCWARTTWTLPCPALPGR